MAGCKEIDFGMRSDDPKSVIVTLKGLDGGSFVKVPDPNSLVFANREYEVLMRVKETSGGVLEMTPAGIYFPGFGFWGRSALNTKSSQGYTYHSSAIV